MLSLRHIEAATLLTRSSTVLQFRLLTDGNGVNTNSYFLKLFLLNYLIDIDSNYLFFKIL